jgi:hypothetical protein
MLCCVACFSKRSATGQDQDQCGRQGVLHHAADSAATGEHVQDSLLVIHLDEKGQGLFALPVA